MTLPPKGFITLKTYCNERRWKFYQLEENEEKTRYRFLDPNSQVHDFRNLKEARVWIKDYRGPSPILPKLQEKWCETHQQECTQDEEGQDYQPVYSFSMDGEKVSCDIGVGIAVDTKTPYDCDTSNGYWVYGPPGNACSTLCPDHVDVSALDYQTP